MFFSIVTLSAAGLAFATFIDVLIVALIILNIIRGHRIGLPRQLVSDSGFVIGMFLGVVMVPLMVVFTTDRLGRTLVTLVTVLATGLFVGFAADRLALWLKVHPLSHAARTLDSVVAAVLSGVTTLILIWLISAMFLTTPFAYLGSGLQRSLILRGITGVLPPAPTIMSHVQSIIDPNGVPQVFTGLEPWPAKMVVGADKANVDIAVALAGASVVRIQGLICGGLVTGGGFVVAPDVVMTNAHVIAGFKNVLIVDQNGPHVGTPIYFDGSQDVALVRVSNLSGRPLHLVDEPVPAGSRAVVMGYPDSGPFSAVPAGIASMDLLRGLDIKNAKTVDRMAYTINAPIRPGSSGGPVVLPDGTVIGMVFARSLLADGLGYALTSPDLIQILNLAGTHTEPVGTGTCASD